MKYNIVDVNIPQEKRKEINDKILHIIDFSLDCNISKEDIFNCYSGDGKLHNLQRSDYDNYYQYSEAKKIEENGQFFTPHKIAKMMVDCIKPTQTDLIADLTCGMGNFFNYLPVEQNIYGCELDIKAYKVAKYLYSNANLECQDIRYYNPNVKFDIVFGNPPFNLKWEINRDEYLSQLYYYIKASELLKPAGILILITPDSFLKNDFMDSGMIKTIDNLFNFVGQFDLKPDSFKSIGVVNFQTKVLIFQRKSEHLKDKPYNTKKLFSNSVVEQDINLIHNLYVKPILAEKEKIRSKLFLENLHLNSEEKQFYYKVKKLLYDIKRNPKTIKNYGRCADYLNKYQTQKKPDDMKFEEWEKVRITKDKVTKYLTKYLKRQNKVEQDLIKLVKSKYGLKLKAYSYKSKLSLSKITERKESSFNEMIINDYYPFNDKQYWKVLSKKCINYDKQNISFKEMLPDNKIATWLDEFSLFNYETNEEIKLNDAQKADLNKIFQKKYSILNWQQGSGKSIAGIAWYKYLFENKNIRNVFIVSDAISINLTWNVFLQNFKEDFIFIKNLQDIYNIKQNQIVIISFNMLAKYQRHIKKYIKMQSQKVALVMDESDETTNHNSKRTKASLSCFRKVHYKLLTTGTTTRNNINELYSQLELLYNNSVNMLCECDTVYKLNKENEIVESDNKYYMNPYPAWYGNGLFKSCFNPYKATVFGIKKHNQDIYNIEQLEKIISKTIITKTFEQIVGKKIYEIKTHKVLQNESEKEIYKVLMQEFYKMQYYFKSTGNSRKDSMLKIIRQIQLLIKSTSTPHLFKEYSSNKLPNKYYKVFDLLNQFKDEKVAIGTVFIDTVNNYYDILKEQFPDRPIFIIRGDVSFNKRKGVIADFEQTKNGILLSTQQSLKKSVNISSCDKVIIESLQWNIPKISQYYFRFIRFDSKNFKEVHFVTYDYTIEQNLLALLMVKERINEYIKTLEFKERQEIFEEYGIDIDILENIIEKEKDEEGHVRLTWGNQKVS